MELFIKCELLIMAFSNTSRLMLPPLNEPLLSLNRHLLIFTLIDCVIYSTPPIPAKFSLKFMSSNIILYKLPYKNPPYDALLCDICELLIINLESFKVECE